MEATSTPAAQFLLQDLLTGKFRPELLTWEEAKAAAAADGFVEIRRADEVGA